MSSVKKPNYAPTENGLSYNWSQLKLVSNFSNCDSFHFDTYPGSLTLETQNYTSRLAKVLYHLGKCFDITYTLSGSGVLDSYVVIGLKKLDNYFSNARLVKVEAYLNSIYDNLDNGKPMYIRGNNTSTGNGHAWVVDGYFCQTRSVTTLIQGGYTGPITTLHGSEERKFLHFNWGNVGFCDGYFSEGIYDMSKRYSRDEVIDNLTDIGTKSYNYNNSNQVILY